MTRVGTELRNRGRVGCYIDILVVTKTLQEVNTLKEILGRRDQGTGTLSKDPTSALDFKDLGLWLTKLHKRIWVNLHCD